MLKKASCMRVFSLFNSRWGPLLSWLSTPTNGLRIKTLGEFKPHFLAAYEAMPPTDLSAQPPTGYAPLQRFVDRLSMVMGHVEPGSSAELVRSNSLWPGLPRKTGPLSLEEAWEFLKDGERDDLPLGRLTASESRRFLHRVSLLLNAKPEDVAVLFAKLDPQGAAAPMQGYNVFAQLEAYLARDPELKPFLEANGVDCLAAIALQFSSDLAGVLAKTLNAMALLAETKPVCVAFKNADANACPWVVVDPTTFCNQTGEVAVVKLEPHLFSNLPIPHALLLALLAPFQNVQGADHASTIGIGVICDRTNAHWTQFSPSELLISVLDRAREDLFNLTAATKT